MRGVVYLVGAGPGDPGLITQRGADLLARADVVVYDGLASPVLLRLAPEGCERIYAGKKRSPAGDPLTQADIERVLVERALDGKRVVRLKGGDPFVFGRGAEECEALAAAGVAFEVVPGVSAASAVPAYAGIPLTARGVASTVAFATGHEAEPEAVDWPAIARADTVVLFMALTTVADCCARLVAAGRDRATPAAAIHWGTTAAQRTVVSTLGDLPAAVAGLRPPALIVVGEVVRLRERLSWHEGRPLGGRRVLVTRAAGQAEKVVRAVAELGGEPMVAALTRLVPPADPAPLAAALDRLAGYRWVVFTSANAVDHFFAALAARGLDARGLAAARLACVGRATAAALARRGLTADLVPPHGDAAGVARAVLAADASPGAVLVPRAERGREEAAALLAAAGAEVDLVPVYRLEPVPPTDPALAHALARLAAGEVSAVAFFAPSQVRALVELAGADALARVPVLAAIGETTAGALRDSGLAPAVVASAPDGEALVAAIAAALAPTHHEET